LFDAQRWANRKDGLLLQVEISNVSAKVWDWPGYLQIDNETFEAYISDDLYVPQLS